MKLKSIISDTFLVWVLLITFLGGFLRFYKLDWGGGFFFHPDEYHIAAAVSRLKFPSQMNPELFSYGSFTVYLIYFIKKLFLSEANPILVGRAISATFSTLTIPVTFLISKKAFKNTPTALASAFLVAITPGLIQQAHYTTPESNLIFFLTITLLLWIMWFQSSKAIYYFISAASLGFAMGIKIVAIVFLPISITLPLFKYRLKKRKFRIPRKLAYTVCFSLIFLLIAGISYFLVFPYSILNWKDFQSSMRYETGVGKGDPLVFYTRQFIDTVPVIFQFRKILPYALGPTILVLGTAGFFLAIKELFAKIPKKERKDSYPLLLVVLSFLVYFVPSAFLFAKWTRFIAPSFPFWSIFTAYFIYRISSRLKNKIQQTRLFFILSTIVITTTSIWTIMFFSIYTHKDIRTTTTTWLEKNLPPNSLILTEAGNMLEVPLNDIPQKLAFDFYHLDENRELQFKLPELLTRADYFIVQSRRMYKNHQRLPNMFPITSNFYDQLFNKNLGFVKIQEFSSYPRFEIGNWKFSLPDEEAEETWSVFDHPVIRIYKKVNRLTTRDYEKILKI